MFELLDGYVMKVSEVKTRAQVAIIKEFYGLQRKILIKREGDVISFHWLKINLINGEYGEDHLANDEIFFVIGDISESVIPVDGVAYIEVQVEESGLLLKTINSDVDNGEVIL